MTQTSLLILLMAAFVCIWAAWDVSRAVRIARRLRGTRIVACPETGCAASVAIDVRHAIATGLVEHAPRVRLSGCSRWRERGRCSEPCIHEAADPASTTRRIVEAGMAGKPCVYCGRRIERPTFLDHHAAFLRADGSTIAWPDVAPVRLREALATLHPVCWDCHIAESFRRKFPDLVTDRPWSRA